jgi:leucyl/phenylalanyl-tRNA--protein transferase
MPYPLEKKLVFPPVQLADRYGRLAYGGDVSPERLRLAYRSGIFPWYSGDVPIWYCPDPRFVLFPEELIFAKSLRPVLRKQKFVVRFNTDFENVLKNCQSTYRPGQDGETWITDELFESLLILNKTGIAVSVETYENGQLVGGLFGEIFGEIFFGESMFAHVSNASKVAFVTLVQNLQEAGIKIIDCQVHTEYLESFGARMISRKMFSNYLDAHFEKPSLLGRIAQNWHAYRFAE